jgi:hypothetical protein
LEAYDMGINEFALIFEKISANHQKSVIQNGGCKYWLKLLGRRKPSKKVKSEI